MAPASASAQVVVGALTALAVAALDATLVVLGIAGAGGAFQFVPTRIWVVAPLIWMLLAAVVGGLLLLITRERAGVCVAATISVAFMAIRLRAHPALLFVSIAVLGGASVLGSRWIDRWMARPRRATAVSLLGILGACAAIAVPRPAPPASIAPEPAEGPNVIVIFLDTVRYDAVFDADGDVHGDLETLARLRRESTVFTHAYATSPWTLPSHLSAVTGLPSHELGVSFDSQVYTGAEQTLAERFRRRGYRTAAVLSNSFLNAGSGFSRGFETFEQAEAGLDICRTAPGVLAERHWRWFAASVCNWTAGEVTRRARRLLMDEARPLFLVLNYMDAHDPYYVERGCGTDRGYRAAIRCIDRHLAPIVDWRSARRPTVLAILGDHGEQFGEHGLVRHGNSLYVQLLHVPMMVRPAQAASGTRAEPVSIAALPALLGLTEKRRQPDAPIVALHHPPAGEMLGTAWSALDAEWHLIVQEHGSEALYHLPTDPAEAHNRITTAGADPAVARLRASIDAMRRVPRPDLRRFRSLGYVH